MADLHVKTSSQASQKFHKAEFFLPFDSKFRRVGKFKVGLVNSF